MLMNIRLVLNICQDSNLAAHEWVFEFNNIPDDIDKFTEILDEKLKKLNSDYAAKRNKNLALQKPIIHIVPSGFFING